jgi:hypothetical protein
MLNTIRDDGRITLTFNPETYRCLKLKPHCDRISIWSVASVSKKIFIKEKILWRPAAQWASLKLR